MCAVVEINFIAHVETKSDGPKKRFRSPTRIKHAAQVLTPHAAYVAKELANRGIAIPPRPNQHGG
jgi:hypothetical protein